MRNHPSINTASFKTDLFGVLIKWMALTRPFHDLTDQEQRTVAAFIYQYIKIRHNINNEEIVWKMVFDYDTKTEVKQMLGGIKDYSLQNVLSRLRTKEVIVDNKIQKSYIPNIYWDTKHYKIVFDFYVKQEVKEEVAQDSSS